MSLHSAIQYCLYRLKAKNRHGIHSPFVYALQEECLLKNPELPLSERLSNYFGSEQVVELLPEVGSWPGYLSLLTKNNVLLLPDIHSRESNSRAWKKLCADERVLMSIDLFDVGLLLSREDFKVQQHFVLRYKK